MLVKVWPRLTNCTLDFASSNTSAHQKITLQVFKILCSSIKTAVSTHSQISLILYFVEYKQHKFKDWYVHPDWAYTLGWTMSLSPLVMGLLTTAVQMCLTAGTFRQVGVGHVWRQFSC